MKIFCPECGSDDVAQPDCEKCEGHGYTGNDIDNECEACWGLGLSENEMECMTCGEIFAD